jgi:hypothetical protein
VVENWRFPPPWTVDRPRHDSFVVSHSKLTSGEAPKIAKAISHIPEFMMQRRGFFARGRATTAGS